MEKATHRVTRSDAALLAAARSDPQAFREFYDRYALWVHAWFKCHAGSESAALDLTAETFAQAWHSLRRFRDLADGSGAPWLFGIARNLLRQYHKSNRIETAARERLGLPLAFADSDDYEAVDERVAARSLAPALRAAVGVLPPDQRRALQGERVAPQPPHPACLDSSHCGRAAPPMRLVSYPDPARRA